MSRLNERIENFNKAFALFQDMRNNYVADKYNNSNRLALTQGFEIVFELAWKVLKDYLATKDIEALTPRDCIKESFSINVLSNAQIWIDMAKDRNATSHEYNMEKVDKLLERVSSEYYEELVRFSEQIKGFND